MIIYCVRCKKKVEVDKTRTGKTKLGRSFAMGRCPECGHKVSTLIKSKKKEGE